MFRALLPLLVLVVGMQPLYAQQPTYYQANGLRLPANTTGQAVSVTREQPIQYQSDQVWVALAWSSQGSIVSVTPWQPVQTSAQFTQVSYIAAPPPASVMVQQAQSQPVFVYSGAAEPVYSYSSFQAPVCVNCTASAFPLATAPVAVSYANYQAAPVRRTLFSRSFSGGFSGGCAGGRCR